MTMEKGSETVSWKDRKTNEWVRQQVKVSEDNNSERRQQHAARSEEKEDQEEEETLWFRCQ